VSFIFAITHTHTHTHAQINKKIHMHTHVYSFHWHQRKTSSLLSPNYALLTRVIYIRIKQMISLNVMYACELKIWYLLKIILIKCLLYSIFLLPSPKCWPKLNMIQTLIAVTKSSLYFAPFILSLAIQVQLLYGIVVMTGLQIAI